jgi:hypothetical protein
LGIAVFYLLYRGGFGFFGEDVRAVLKLDHAAVGAVGKNLLLPAETSRTKSGMGQIFIQVGPGKSKTTNLDVI